jgi:hypothetical protein
VGASGDASRPAVARPDAKEEGDLSNEISDKSPTGDGRAPAQLLDWLAVKAVIDDYLNAWSWQVPESLVTITEDVPAKSDVHIPAPTAVTALTGSSESNGADGQADTNRSARRDEDAAVKALPAQAPPGIHLTNAGENGSPVGFLLDNQSVTLEPGAGQVLVFGRSVGSVVITAISVPAVDHVGNSFQTAQSFVDSFGRRGSGLVDQANARLKHALSEYRLNGS